MSKIPANRSRIFVHEARLSTHLNSYTLGHDQETPDVTAFEDVGGRVVAANYKAEQDLMGFFDGVPGVTSFDAVLFALLGTEERFVGVLPLGETPGAVAYEYLSALASEPRSGATGGAVVLGAKLAGDGPVVRGMVIGAGLVGGAGSQLGVNQGVTVSGQRYAAVFRLLAFTGVNITLNLQESQNDGGADPYATIAGMTSGALTAPGAVRTVTTAATETWKRLNYTGTFSSALLLLTAGVEAPGGS